MENNAWSPGIWKRWENRNFAPETGREVYFKYDYYPSIDCNVGPVLGCDIEPGSNDETFQGETSSSAVQAQKWKFLRTINVSNKFPLKKSLKFAYPLTNPKTIYKVCHCDEEYNFLWHQGGNNLATFESQGKNFLVYPVYPEILEEKQSVIVSEIIPRNFKGLEQSSDKVFYSIERRNKLLSDCQSEICQIIAKEVNNKAYVLSRSKNAVQYYSFREDLNSDTKIFIPDNKDSDVTTSATLSDTIPGYIATAVSSGNVFLYDMSRSQSTNIWNHFFAETGDCVYQCDFGRHPLCLTVNNRYKIYLCDTRIPIFDTSMQVQTFCNVKDLHSYMNPHDIICKVVQSGIHDLYVVTSGSVLLMDERYSKLPTMKWDHMSTSPSFATLCLIKDFEVLVFGSSTEFRLCSVYQDMKNKAGGQCFSGIPFHFNTVRDTFHFAHMQNIWFNIHADRIGNRFTGLASCVNPSDESSLCLLTLNNCGDIFIQDFSVQCNDTLSESNDVILHDQIGKKILQSWEKEVVQLTLEESYVKGSSKEKIYRNLDTFYSDVKKLSVNPNDDQLANNQKLWSVENHVLKKYSGKKLFSGKYFKLDLIVKDNLSREEGLAKFLPAEISNYIKSSYFKNCKDELSSSLIKIWEDQVEDEEEMGGQFVKYSRIPCETVNFPHLKKKLKTHHSLNDTNCDPEFSFLTTQREDEFSLLTTPKRSGLEILSTSPHPQKHRIERSIKKRVDGF